MARQSSSSVTGGRSAPSSEADIGVVGAWVRIGPDHIPEHTSAALLLEDLETHEATLRRNCEALVDWFVHEIAGLDS